MMGEGVIFVVEEELEVTTVLTSPELTANIVNTNNNNELIPR
jgi:hypothetical protein